MVLLLGNTVWLRSVFIVFITLRYSEVLYSVCLFRHGKTEQNMNPTSVRSTFIFHQGTI